MDSLDFNKAVAIVTGAGKGLGKAHALALARRGARVVVNNRRHPEDGNWGSADQTVETIRQNGGDARANYDDITTAGAAERLVETALTAFGRVDILFLNAAVNPLGMFHKQDTAHFRAVMEVNFFANISLLQTVVPIMRNQEYGRIVFTISSAGLYGLPGGSAYSASKGALHALMLSLAAENAKKNIRCNALAPFAVSQMTEDSIDDTVKALLTAEATTGMALWLAHRECLSNGDTWIAAGNRFRRAHCVENAGFGTGSELATPEWIAENYEALSNMDDSRHFSTSLAAFYSLVNDLKGSR